MTTAITLGYKSIYIRKSLKIEKDSNLKMVYCEATMIGELLMTEYEELNRTLIDRNDCVLLVIDVQDKLLPFIAHKEKMVENIVKLVKFSKIVNIPVIVTEQEKLGDTVQEIKDELAEVQPIGKICYSCFSCEAFVNSIKKLERKTLIITGMETHICVAQTTFHALPEFIVHIVSDAVSSRFVENWTVGIDRMRASGAVISSTEMVIFEILRQAGTDEFRATLPLVRER
jgi:isochorismate hydrolase